MGAISARLAKRHAFFGKLDKTATGLKKTDLVKNKAGRIVSKKKSQLGKASPWLAAEAGPLSFEDQGLPRNQEGHSPLQEGQGVVRQVSILYRKVKELHH